MTTYKVTSKITQVSEVDKVVLRDEEYSFETTVVKQGVRGTVTDNEGKLLFDALSEDTPKRYIYFTLLQGKVGVYFGSSFEGYPELGDSNDGDMYLIMEAPGEIVLNGAMVEYFGVLGHASTSEYSYYLGD